MHMAENVVLHTQVRMAAPHPTRVKLCCRKSIFFFSWGLSLVSTMKYCLSHVVLDGERLWNLCLSVK